MTEKSTSTIVSYTLKEIEAMPKESWKRFDQISDEQIDYSDDAKTDKSFWDNAEVVDLSKSETTSIEVPKVLIPRIRKLIAEHMKSGGSSIG